MMRTEDLIKSLAGDLTPVSRWAVGQRLTIGMIAGAVVTLAMIAAGLGFRHDLPGAMTGFPFLMKWAYTISLGVGAIAATVHLSRPDAQRADWLWLLVVPFGLLACVAINELAHTPRDGWLVTWLGRSWSKCPVLVLALSLPIFGGLLWAFRKLAPTRLRAAGAAAGMAAGASAATLYGLHCPEVSASFVLTWYTLGIALATGLGALVGPRVMRW